MRAKNLNGFSLMEMMVVLLIVAIVAAASAPMVTKKLTRNAGTGDSPWVFTGLNNTIAYLGGNNSQVLIGATVPPDDLSRETMLYIAGRNNWSHIRFGNSAGNNSIGITADPGDNAGRNSRIGISNLVPNNNSILFGTNQTVNNNATGIISIGTNNSVGRQNSITIGGVPDHINENAEIKARYGSRTSTRAQGGTSVAIGQGCVAGEINHRATSTNNFDSWATAIGVDAYAPGESSVAIGVQPTASGNWSTALGSGTKAFATRAVAVGMDAQVSNESNQGVAIGNNATLTGESTDSIAIGNNANVANSMWSIAIGSNAKAMGEDAIAIGNNVTAGSDQIILGKSNHTVYIPGNLVVGGNVILNQDDTSARTSIRVNQGSKSSGATKISVINTKLERISPSPIEHYTDTIRASIISDRRLKNVGERYTAGLEELKKLDFFHFTFKKDKAKTPHVGVMAQDLQKVFPDAVTKGEDGYLRIRWEDMFYAVINAVKEMDNKICEITKNITDINSKLEKQNKIIEEQQKTIECQQKTIDELINRIEKLEQG